MSLSLDEHIRYRNHLQLPEIGLEGQLKIKNSRILVVGAGGLGCPASLYLTAAGVGTLGIVDEDQVSLSNLQRQILYTSEQIGKSKVVAAKQHLSSLNPTTHIQTYEVRLTVHNAKEIIELFDLVIDGTDNFSTRYLINDACVLLRKPNIYGALFGFEGQASLFFPLKGGPCYRCLYSEPPRANARPGCSDYGVLGVLPGIIGTLQATEALKWILGIGKSLVGRLLLFDGLQMNFSLLQLQSNPQCPVCGESPRIQVLNESEYRYEPPSRYE